jgi:hypothetical protein
VWCGSAVVMSGASRCGVVPCSHHALILPPTHHTSLATPTGGVGFDINCGVRLLRTNLDESDIAPIKEQLAQSLFDHIPVGVGSKVLLPPARPHFVFACARTLVHPRGHMSVRMLTSACNSSLSSRAPDAAHCLTVNNRFAGCLLTLTVARV